MPEDKNNSAERRKFLNVIYFVDSNRTRSFKVQVGTASYLALAIFGFSLWTIISTFMLYQAETKTHKLTQEKKGLLATIFDYQVKYDNVYEKTYPKTKPKPVESLAPSVPEATPPPANIAQPAAIAKVEPLVPPTELELGQSPVTVENLAATPTNRGLVVNFSIKNLKRPEKVEGHLWGLANFKTEGGQSKVVSSPPALEGQSKEYILKNLRKTEMFGIRYYKAKKLRFEMPDESGHFTKIGIYGALGDLVYELKTLSLEKGTEANIATSAPISERSKN